MGGVDLRCSKYDLSERRGDGKEVKWEESRGDRRKGKRDSFRFFTA